MKETPCSVSFITRRSPTTGRLKLPCNYIEDEKYLVLVSKSHTQFCQADSYCNSATWGKSDEWELTEMQPWESLTTCTLYKDGVEVRNKKDVEEDVDGEEKVLVPSRKCYNRTIQILCSKIHNPCFCYTYLYIYYTFHLLLTNFLTSAVACGFSDDRPFRYILIT